MQSSFAFEHIRTRISSNGGWYWSGLLAVRQYILHGKDWVSFAIAEDWVWDDNRLCICDACHFDVSRRVWCHFGIVRLSKFWYL